MLRGTTHRSGIGARSVVRYVVSPSIRLEGMNARRIHRPRFQREIEAAGSRIARLSPALRVPGTTCGFLDVREGQTTAAQPTSKSRSDCHGLLPERDSRYRCALTPLS